MRLVLILSLLFCVLPGLHAGTLSLSVSPANLTVGESATVTITLEGEGGNPVVAMRPSCPGLDINWGSTSRSQNMSIMNGAVSQKLVFSWPARATREGEFTLTPMQMQINGQVLKSNAVAIRVTPAQTSSFFLLKAHVNSTECYTGQVIELFLDFLLSDQEIRRYESVAGNNYELAGNHYDPVQLPPELYTDFNVTAKTSRTDNSAPPRYFGVPAGTVMEGGFPFRVHRVVLLLEPKRTGRLAIPAFSTSFFRLQLVETRVQGFFGFQPAQQLQKAAPPYVATTPPLILKVSDPPLEGRPAEWNGLVCQFLSAELQVQDLEKGQKVQLHSPLAVKVILKSDLPASALKLPPWETQTALNAGFDVSRYAAVSETLEGGMSFKEIVFRPKANVKEIPALAFSWFDPTEKKYKTVHTEPYPLNVELVAKDEALASQPAALLALNKEEVKPTIGRIEGLETNPELLLSESRSGWSWLWVGSLAAFPWLALLLRDGSATLKERLSLRRESGRHGLEDSLAQLRHAQSPAEIHKIATAYISRRFLLSDPHALALRDEALTRELRHLLENLEAALYASGGAATVPAAEKAAELLRRLDKAERS